MTNLEQIRTWLNTRPADYTKGVALMQSYSNKPATCASLLKIRDHSKLRNHILQLFQSLEKTVAPIGTAIPVTKEANSGTPRGATGILKALDALKSKLYYIGRESSGNTRPLSEEEKNIRKQIASEIMNLDNQYNTLVNPAKVPQPIQATPAASSGDNYKDQENCRKNVSRLKAKIAKAESDRLQTTSEKHVKKLTSNLDTWQQQLTRAEKKLNELRNGK